MKKIFCTIGVIICMSVIMVGCAQKEVNTDNNPVSGTETQETIVVDSKITEKMAYDGVNNYCHSEYDWSITEENPDIMYVNMGEETETEYQVIFRSYTGAFVHFYVDKSSGIARMIEIVPNLDIEEEVGTINIHDYLEKID